MTIHKRLLIEEWLPIAELSEESIRERRSMTALPPIYYLHVWWARRPLVASRAAVLASLLPADFDCDQFKYLLGIHGDPIAARAKIDEAVRTGIRVNDPYGYDRAFKYKPSKKDLIDIKEILEKKVLDPTSGGGSIPYETIRIGGCSIANDLNPIAWLILKCTIEFPEKFKNELLKKYQEISEIFLTKLKESIHPLFPNVERENEIDTTYLYARTVICPSCGGLVPLSPNWKLSKTHGVKLVSLISATLSERKIKFEIVKSQEEISHGTVKGGTGLCPYSDCGATINGDDIKKQAQEGNMGDILYAIVLKRKTRPAHDGVRGRKWVRDFRAPRPEDDVTEIMEKAWTEKKAVWDVDGIIPDEYILEGHKTNEPIRYGMVYWRDLFSSRQLFGHCTSVEVFQKSLKEYEQEGKLDEVAKAAFCYVAIALDKMLNYNARLVRWHVKREVIAGVFDRHDFAFLWSFAEMAPTITGVGYDWAFEQTGKCIKELFELIRGKDSETLFVKDSNRKDTNFTLTLGSAENLSIEDNSIDAVVMDPPYYDNVMYAELSDYFYVWLKRTAGILFPEAFQGYLTDKEREAVANPARFRGQKKAKDIAGLDYQKRMARIFQECKRVLKSEGVLTVMFTHKASEAWDALAKGLVEAGFTITASWPINTEAEGSLHIKDKTAAKSTVFLVCRKFDKTNKEISFWEEVEPLVEERVLSKIESFQKAGIKGVDLYLANFGPALEVFSENLPLKRANPRLEPKNRNGVLYGKWDPYAVFPEDALNSARNVVKEWRLQQLLSVKRQREFDKLTEFYILAWDAFGAPKFPADEAMKLARVIGLDFDLEIKNKVCEVKSGNVKLLDSRARKGKGKTLSVKTGIWIDALHSAAAAIHETDLTAGKNVLEKAELLEESGLQASLEALLKVLPPQKGSDFEVLNNLRKLCYTEE